MTFNDTYASGEIVFSKSAGNIAVTGAGTSPVPLSVAIDGEEVASYEVQPYNGTAIIYLRDLLVSLSERLKLPISISRDGYTKTAIKTVSIVSGSETWSHPVINGYKSSMGDLDLWSQSPELSQTFLDSVEMLSMRSMAGATLKAYIRFVSGESSTITLATLSESGAYIVSRDCSYSAIRNAAVKAGITEEIVGYDIRLEGLVNGRWKKFSVSRRRHYQYVFRNSYGTFDSIFALGEKSRLLDSETSTFINSGLESELANNALVKFEQNTGYIASRSQSRFWTGFLSSNERYVLENNTLRRIVIDEADPKMTEGQLSSFKFKWHYADIYSQEEFLRDTSPDTPDEPGENPGGGTTDPGTGSGGTSSGKLYAITANPMVIKHNLNRYPSVTVIDADFCEVTTKVSYPSLDEIKVEWNQQPDEKASGYIYIV